MAVGTVKFFKPEKGWGALMTDELPDGQDVFVHFSSIEGSGFRAFEAGDLVEFEYEAGHQDSFRFRATRARRVESGPAPTLGRQGDRVVVAPDGTPEAPRTPRRPPRPVGNAASEGAQSHDG